MKEGEGNRNFGEKTGDFFKRYGLIGALIGVVAMLAVEGPIGGTIFVASAIVGGGGVAVEKLSGGKKK